MVEAGLARIISGFACACMVDCARRPAHSLFAGPAPRHANPLCPGPPATQLVGAPSAPGALQPPGRFSGRALLGADIDGLIDLAKESALADGLSGLERGLRDGDFDAAFPQIQASTLDWLRTVRNVVKYAGDDGTYKDVERYLKQVRML